MNKIKKIITNIWAIITFITIGGGGAVAEFVYFGPKRDVEEWIYQYRSTAEGEGAYQDGKVRVKWNIMKVPPTGESYTVVPYIATPNLSVLYSIPASVQIAGIWGISQTAVDWEDFNRITYIGSEIDIPEHLQKPGTYAIIYYVLIQTDYGLYQAELAPVFYTITE